MVDTRLTIPFIPFIPVKKSLPLLQEPLFPTSFALTLRNFAYFAVIALTALTGIALSGFRFFTRNDADLRSMFQVPGSMFKVVSFSVPLFEIALAALLGTAPLPKFQPSFAYSASSAFKITALKGPAFLQITSHESRITSHGF